MDRAIRLQLEQRLGRLHARQRLGIAAPVKYRVAQASLEAAGLSGI